MIQHKFLGFGMEAHIQHGQQRQYAAGGKDQIQGENVAQETVQERGQRHAAAGGRLNEAEDRAAVFLRQRQH